MEFKALVLEFMPNGNLDEWLYSKNKPLNLFQRLNILTDVALAMEYLHHDYVTQIVQCDLMPNNVLLDEDMTAHVTDFGIAKMLGMLYHYGNPIIKNNSDPAQDTQCLYLNL
ncbi:hypothetical protein LIER_36099 [Lithospermum erythrorhizon]|uniref:Protein kinase domain-containing protein n=1 Tax=Lithospermum erythrorhizon TaxID=34254 RepID=A0AAV3P5J9_LITER